MEHDVRTAKRVDGYKHGPDVCVDLAVLPAFLQVLVYALVADCGQECHVGHADLFLLESLLPVRLNEEIKHRSFTEARSMRTLATLAGPPPPFFGATFLPAFFDGA